MFAVSGQRSDSGRTASQDLGPGLVLHQRGGEDGERPCHWKEVSSHIFFFFFFFFLFFFREGASLLIYYAVELFSYTHCLLFCNESISLVSVRAMIISLPIGRVINSLSS